MVTAGERGATSGQEEEPAASGTAAAAAAGTTQAAQDDSTRGSKPDGGDVVYDPVADDTAAADATEGAKAAAGAANAGAKSSPYLPDGSQAQDGDTATASVDQKGKPGGTSAGKDRSTADAAGDEVTKSSAGSTLGAAAAEAVEVDNSSSQPRAVKRYPDRTGPSASGSDSSGSGGGGGGEGSGGGASAADATETVAEESTDLQSKADTGKRSTGNATGSAADLADDRPEAEGSAGNSTSGSGSTSTDGSVDTGGATSVQKSEHGAAKGTAGTAAQIEEFADDSGSSGEH